MTFLLGLFILIIVFIVFFVSGEVRLKNLKVSILFIFLDYGLGSCGWSLPFYTRIF